MEAKITLLPGDGIGPEVVTEAQKVLDVVAAKKGHTFSYQTGLAGGIAIDETGNPLPEETLGMCLEWERCAAWCGWWSKMERSDCKSAPGARLAEAA